MNDVVILPTRLNQQKTKRWGFGLVLWSFLAFIVSQVALSILVIAVYLAVHPDLTQADLSTAAITQFASQPALLLPLQFAMYAVWVGYMIYATHKRGLHSFRKDFWVRIKWYDVFLGIGYAVVLTGVELGLFKLLGLFPSVFNLKGSDNGTFLFQGHGVWLYITTIGLGGIIGPLFEELYFRGFIMQGLIRYFRKGLRNYPVSILGNNTLVKHPRFYAGYIRFKRWLYKAKYVLAPVLTAIIFGAIHYQGGTTFGAYLVPVFTGFIGLVLGFQVIFYRRLSVNIFTHMAYNTLSIVLTLLGVSIG